MCTFQSCMPTLHYVCPCCIVCVSGTLAKAPLEHRTTKFFTANVKTTFMGF